MDLIGAELAELFALEKLLNLTVYTLASSNVDQ